MTLNVIAMISATMSTPKKTPITIPAMAPLLSILAAAVAMADTVLGGGGAAHGRHHPFKVMLGLLIVSITKIASHGFSDASLAGHVGSCCGLGIPCAARQRGCIQH